MCFSYLCPAATGYRFQIIIYSQHFLYMKKTLVNSCITLQVACLAEEIEIIEKQMADVGINVLPCESSNPYFPTEVDMRSNVISMNDMELQYPDEILEGYLNSSLIDRLVEDYYVHEQLTQDYNLQQPLWIKYAAADQY